MVPREKSNFWVTGHPRAHLRKMQNDFEVPLGEVELHLICRFAAKRAGAATEELLGAQPPHTEIIMPRGQVVERNLRDRFRDNHGLDPRRAFSFIFGNINGWLACRFCGTWHLVADGSFSSEQLQVELADRHCTLPQWSRPHDRRAAITAGSAPLTPTAEVCEQHRAHLGAFRLALLDRHGGEEAEDWVPAEALLDNEPWLRDRRDGAAGRMELVRSRLLLFERRTDAMACSAAFKRRLTAWRTEVDSATEAELLARLFRELIVGTAAKDDSHSFRRCKQQGLCSPPPLPLLSLFAFATAAAARFCCRATPPHALLTACALGSHACALAVMWRSCARRYSTPSQTRALRLTRRTISSGSRPLSSPITNSTSRRRPRSASRLAAASSRTSWRCHGEATSRLLRRG